MADTQSRRKPINLAILNILRNHSNVDHPMRIKAIQEILAEMNMTPTRKSISNNIADLQQAGYPLVFNHGWYYDHEFTSEELNFLIDEVHCAGQLNEETRTVIINKLKQLGGIHFTPSCESVQTKLVNPIFLVNLDLLHKAIQSRLQVSFHYGDYGTDKQLHCRLNEKKRPKLYRINPYSIGTTNGRYYLICNVDKYDSLCHFRIDRILDVKLLKKGVKPIEKVIDGKEGLSIQAYMTSHPNMYSGTPEQFIIQLKKKWLNELFDTFGMDISFRNETDEIVEAILTADPISVGFWLKKYAGDAKLIAGKPPIV